MKRVLVLIGLCLPTVVAAHPGAPGHVHYVGAGLPAHPLIIGLLAVGIMLAVGLLFRIGRAR